MSNGDKWLEGWSDGYGDAKAGSLVEDLSIMPQDYQKGYREGAREWWDFQREQEDRKRNEG